MDRRETVGFWKGAANIAKRRAEKAERERDEARADLAEYVQAQALRTQPRPLAPDAITDEMVERADAELVARAGGDYYPGTIRAVLVAALTEPTRPEGAEEIEAYMRELVASHPEDHYGELADHLASRGVLPPLTDKTHPEEQP